MDGGEGKVEYIVKPTTRLKSYVGDSGFTDFTI